MIEMSCVYCKRVFLVPRCRKNTARFCSNKCRNAAIELRWHTHGHTRGRKRSPEQQSYTNMIQRCYNANRKEYDQYGGRGITVCTEWQGENGFITFIGDLGKRPLGFTLERINNDQGYFPSNCKWASRKEQANNRRFKLAGNIVDLLKHGTEYAYKDKCCRCIECRTQHATRVALWRKRKAGIVQWQGHTLPTC